VDRSDFADRFCGQILRTAAYRGNIEGIENFSFAPLTREPGPPDQCSPHWYTGGPIITQHPAEVEVAATAAGYTIHHIQWKLGRAAAAETEKPKWMVSKFLGDSRVPDRPRPRRRRGEWDWLLVVRSVLQKDECADKIWASASAELLLLRKYEYEQLFFFFFFRRRLLLVDAD